MNWKNIHGYTGLYLINKSGQIKSLPRNTTRGKILKHLYDSNGYAMIGLCKKGKVKCFRIHALVARAFIGPYPKGMEINHKDGDKGNPRLKNIEYGTHRHNMLHSKRVLKNKGGVFKGEENHAHKLTEKEILEIRNTPIIRWYGHSTALGIKYNVHPSLIPGILKRTRWRHI